MKVLGKIVLFGVGAALGYYLANNKVDIEINTEPIVNKVKEKINQVMGKNSCDSESCDCGDVIDEAADKAEDFVEDIADGVKDAIDDFGGANA